MLFNGIRIGEVTELALDPRAPRQVVAVISVDKRAAVRADTWVGLDYQGLTGIAAIALRGGSDHAPLAAGGNVLKADATARRRRHPGGARRAAQARRVHLRQ